MNSPVRRSGSQRKKNCESAGSRLLHEELQHESPKLYMSRRKKKHFDDIAQPSWILEIFFVQTNFNNRGILGEELYVTIFDIYPPLCFIRKMSPLLLRRDPLECDSGTRSGHGRHILPSPTRVYVHEEVHAYFIRH